MFKLEVGETIVTAYAEKANGPGWANKPLWVIVRDRNQNLREECIQPEKQTKEMHMMYEISEAVHKRMVYEVALMADERYKS